MSLRGDYVLRLCCFLFRMSILRTSAGVLRNVLKRGLCVETLLLSLQDEYLANRLLEYLMEHSHHDNRSVFRNNLEIIKTLVECWREKLQGPTK